MTEEELAGAPTGQDITATRQILPEHRIDDVAEALIALARELSVVADRQIVTEAVLASKGIDVSEIDRFQPDEALEKKLLDRRQQIIDNLLVALKAG